MNPSTQENVYRSLATAASTTDDADGVVTEEPASSKPAAKSKAIDLTDPLQLLNIPLKVALVCQSNLNRSMEAHHLLHSKGYTVWSYGVGTKIRLPGESINKPNVYEFGHSTYDQIYSDLSRKNQQRYTANGILWMLQRDSQVKQRPERWQATATNRTTPHFDIILTFERRVYDAVWLDVAQRNDRKQELIVNGLGDIVEDYESEVCHIINIETTDNHSEAITGANYALQLVERLYECCNKGNDWQAEMLKLIDQWSEDNNKELLHAVVYY